MHENDPISSSGEKPANDAANDAARAADGFDVARTLRAVRRALVLSQREFALRAGLSASSVAAIESGRRVPGALLLDRMLRSCGFRLVVVRVGDQPDRTDRSQPGPTPTVELDDAHDAIRDRGGRRFPAHLRWGGKPDYATMYPSWWGWHRVAWYVSKDPNVPDHVYWLRRRADGTAWEPSVPPPPPPRITWEQFQAQRAAEQMRTDGSVAPE